MPPSAAGDMRTRRWQVGARVPHSRFVVLQVQIQTDEPLTCRYAHKRARKMRPQQAELRLVRGGELISVGARRSFVWTTRKARDTLCSKAKRYCERCTCILHGRGSKMDEVGQEPDFLA